MERFLQQEPDRLVKSKKTGKDVIKYNVSDTLKKEKGMSEQNTTYRLISSMLKGVVPSDVYTCLNQNICKTVKETISDVSRGEATLRSYRNNIPMPFSAKQLSNIHGIDRNALPAPLIALFRLSHTRSLWQAQCRFSRPDRPVLHSQALHWQS